MKLANYLLSFPLQVVNYFRREIYRLGLRRRYLANVPIISIGNIGLGGTGKTPCTKTVVSLLLEMGRMPAIVSRGYGREKPSSLVIVHDGHSTLATAEESGDEPFLLAEYFDRSEKGKNRKTIVVVCSDRKRAIEQSIQLGADVIVLDDGFQQFSIVRSLDILLVDENCFSREVFPAGVLREFVSSLKYAKVVAAPEKLLVDSPMESLSDQTLLPFVVEPINTKNASHRNVTKPEKCLLFSGIANHRRLSATFDSYGIECFQHVVFRDHYRYTNADIARVIRLAKECQATTVMTTEKDIVRLSKDQLKLFEEAQLELSYLEVAMVFPSMIHLREILHNSLNFTITQ